MAVAGYDRPNAGRLEFQIKLAEVMQHVYCYAINFNDLRLRKAAGPRLGIDVAANRRYRSDFGKCDKNFWISNIACVKNLIYPVQRVDRLRTQETVGVRDYTDSCHSLRHLTRILICHTSFVDCSQITGRCEAILRKDG